MAAEKYPANLGNSSSCFLSCPLLLFFEPLSFLLLHLPYRCLLANPEPRIYSGIERMLTDVKLTNSKVVFSDILCLKFSACWLVDTTHQKVDCGSASFR